MKLSILLGSAAACLVVGFAAGREWRDRSAQIELLTKDAEQAAYIAQSHMAWRRAVNQTDELRTARADLLAAAAEAAALRDIEVETVERIVTREVIRYVSAPENNRVLLSPDWVRIHDFAAAGTTADVPGAGDTAREPDAVAAPVTEAAALAVVTDNYATCRAIAADLEGLQDWVRSNVLRIAF